MSKISSNLSGLENLGSFSNNISSYPQRSSGTHNGFSSFLLVTPLENQPSLNSKGISKFDSNMKLTDSYNYNSPLKNEEEEEKQQLEASSILSYEKGYSSKLLDSLIQENNNKAKNQELSLFYCINTFNKAHSNDSNKEEIVFDLPKISKKLFTQNNNTNSPCSLLDCQSSGDLSFENDDDKKTENKENKPSNKALKFKIKYSSNSKRNSLLPKRYEKENSLKAFSFIKMKSSNSILQGMEKIKGKKLFSSEFVSDNNDDEKNIFNEMKTFREENGYCRKISCQNFGSLGFFGDSLQKPIQKKVSKKLTSCLIKDEIKEEDLN